MTLNWSILETDLANLWRAPCLIYGDGEAILVDSGFTLSSGRKQVEQVRASGKSLSRIVVTCHDPDFYFGLTTVKEAFPDVPVVAPASIAAKIAQTAAHKVNVWRDTLGDDGPQSLADVVVPQAIADMRLFLEGQPIDIVQSRQPGFVSLWLPNERAILGGVEISGDNHVWMADVQQREQRADWIASLDAMEALAPLHAPPGHKPPGDLTGLAAIVFTRDYIRAFEDEATRAADTAALIAAMKARYPDLAMEFILELGARVHMGEQVWP